MVFGVCAGTAGAVHLGARTSAGQMRPTITLVYWKQLQFVKIILWGSGNKNK